MKHLLPFFVLTLMFSTQAIGQETYEILRIYNAESISIGNRTKKAGDTFKSTDQIVFSNDRQSFKAQKKGTSKAYYFNKKAMEAKKSKTLKDYFANDYNKTKGSTRGETRNTLAINQGKYDVNKYPEKRIALVIGNGNYQELDILPNAINDARDVSDRLKQLGFDVATLYDGDIYDMLTTVDSFFTVAQSYQVALIYFAGHGIRYEGKDYLLSVNREGLGIKDECSLEYLIDESEKWKSNGKIMIFVIDACRNRKGFSDDDRVPSAKRGTAILQSTSSGEVAMDADAGSGNSPFATAFINGIGSSENNIVEEFEEISKEVTRKTSYRQEPMISRNGVYNFHFCKGHNKPALQSDKVNTIQENTPQSKTAPSQLNPTSTQSKLQTTSSSQTNKSSKNTYTTAQLEEFFQKGEEQYNKKNYTEAVKWYRIAAEQGHADAQTRLGICYLSNEGVKHSFTEAFKWLRLAAEQGNATAQSLIGQGYYIGLGITQSDTEAVKWLNKAAEQGEVNAQYYLGQCYYNGQGVTESYTEAVKWFRKAAEQGEKNAQYYLGKCYYFGLGVAKSYTEAVKWYRMTAEQGHTYAQLELGRCYANGYGVTQSDTEAIKWYRMAAENENSAAQYILGYSYEIGYGVTQSYNEAVKWLRKAAEHGNSAAQYNLGVCYKEGKGVPQSNTEAKKWLRLAAEQGFKDAKKELENM